MTATEKQHLDDIHDMPCMCCVIEQVSQPSRTEAHHLVDKGYRKHSGGHMATIPLCAWHHRGVSLEGRSTRHMLFNFGPSLGLNKKWFVQTYGDERDLLAQISDG